MNALIVLPESRKPAITYEGNTLTFEELTIHKTTIINNLLKEGMTAGVNVGIYVKNPALFIQLYLALWELKVNIIPLDSQLDLERLISIAKFSDLNWLLCEVTTFNDRLIEPLSNIKTIMNVLICDEMNHNIQISKMLKQNYSRSLILNGSEENIILFTSGTSGEPKGVVLKKSSIINNIHKVIKYTQLSSSDKSLMTLPLSYSYGLSQTLAHLMVEGHIVLSRSHLLPATVLSEIELNSINNYSATPYFYESLYYLIKNTNITKPRSLKFFMNAGGFLHQSIIDKIIETFPNIIFYNNYGQTEASPRLSYARFQQHTNDFAGVGKPLPGVHIKIIDEFGKTLDKNKIGEVIYASEDFMIGYHKRSEPLFSSDQFFGSGDLGYLDDQGNLHVVGRKDSMVKINGRKVFLNQIEEKLHTIKEISHVKVVKERHDIYGEYICAYIESPSNQNAELFKRYIMEELQEKIPQYQRPKKIIVCEKINVSANGKILFNKKQ